jgi:uncharacterized protein (TIGR02646 family)
MITIVKGAEPSEWTALNVTPGVTEYEAIPELREALLRDQGYICAYCMRSIPVTKNDPSLPETSKIEHIKSRRHSKDLERSYRNMVICCPGYINGTEHCDKSKKSQEIHFSPFDQTVRASISYRSNDGEIRSTNTNWQHDIDNIICLNNPMLKINRRQVLDGVKAVLERKDYSVKILQEKLIEWSSKDDDGKLKAYCGVVIWYLAKKIRAQR